MQLSNQTLLAAKEKMVTQEQTIWTRREFVKNVTVGTIAAGVGSALLPTAAKASGSLAKPETKVKALFASLTPVQKEAFVFPWNHPKRTQVAANWGIVPQSISAQFSADQQEMVRQILRGVTTDEWFPKILAQMQNDAGGFGNYHVALFGDPTTPNFEWVLTGRHVTLRASGHHDDTAAFGGPVFYGHAPHDTEDARHTGNIYWPQIVQANAVFNALNGKQRSVALLDRAPDESTIHLQGASGHFPGIAIADLSHDQKALVQTVMHSLLSPYRPEDAREVLDDLKANGGLDAVHLSFYKQDDLGNDGIWDIWRLEGPAFVWHFRGAPHVHTWVNVAKNAATSEGHV